MEVNLERSWSSSIKNSPTLKKDEFQSHLVKKNKQDVPHIELTEKACFFLVNANLLYENHEYQLALNLLREVLKEDSFNQTVLTSMARCYLELKQFSEAERCLRVLQENKSSFQRSVHPYFHFLLGMALYQQKNDEEAYKSFFQFINLQKEQDDSTYEALKNLGNICCRNFDFEGAEDFYNKALRLNPDTDVLLVNYGTLAIQKEDYEKAKIKFREALARNSKNDKAWVGLAIVHNIFGDFDLAWGNLEHALDFNPGNRTGVILCLQWGVRDRRYSALQGFVENYLDVSDFDEEISLIYAEILFGLGQLDKAEIEIERVLLFNPESTKAVELRNLVKVGDIWKRQ